MSNLRTHHRRRFARRSAVSVAAMSIVAIAITLLACESVAAQSTRSSTATPAGPAAARTTTLASGPDLQGLWDFTMRVGERTSTGFFALGPVERGWAGSLTPDSTNTLAIRVLTVVGDSVRMIVASREGDVRFQGRLTNDARTMEGIVEYHGGALLPMTATRRTRRVVPH